VSINNPFTDKPGGMPNKMDEEYISHNEFKDIYEQARRIPRGVTAVRGFINYLKKYEERKEANREP